MGHALHVLAVAAGEHVLLVHGGVAHVGVEQDGLFACARHLAPDVQCEEGLAFVRLTADDHDLADIAA